MAASILPISSYRKPSVTFVTSARSGAMSSGSLSITIPSHQNGDIIMLYIGAQSPFLAVNPTGFTSINSAANTSAGASRSVRVTSKFGNGSSETLSLISFGNSTLAYAGCLIFRYASAVGSSNSFSNTTTIAPGGTNATMPGLSISNPVALGAVVGMTYINAISTATGMIVSNNMAYILAPSTFTSRLYTVTGSSSIVNLCVTAEIV